MITQLNYFIILFDMTFKMDIVEEDYYLILLQALHLLCDGCVDTEIKSDKKGGAITTLCSSLTKI